MEAGGDALGGRVGFFGLGAGAERLHAELGFGVEVVELGAVPGVFVQAAVHQVPETGAVDHVQSRFGVGWEAVGGHGFEMFAGVVMELEQVGSVLERFPQGVDVGMGPYKLVRVTPSAFYFRCPVDHFL